MELLEKKILEEGRILGGDILKVDCFLNHMVDPFLIESMGKDFAAHFAKKDVTKVLTLEVSGIVIAYAAALELKVPMVFAKKISSKTLSEETYVSKVFSFTKNREYEIRVDKRFLTKDDNVLIIDDFLANGKALGGLVEICEQAQCNVAGMGIAIEKFFQGGGDKFRKLGYDVYSQAAIEKFTDKGPIFKR